MTRLSVMMTPLKPSVPRIWPVMISGESEAGRVGTLSIFGSATCATSTVETPAAMAARHEMGRFAPSCAHVNGTVGRL